MTVSAQKGFTLVELAIALMVIGLLIGGVLKGQELIENARLTAFIRQVKAVDTAAMVFRNTYGAYPGDIKKPNRIPNCTTAICNQPGNGNGKIDATFTAPENIEAFNFFPHLTKAGMLQSSATGVDDEATANNTPELVYLQTPHETYMAVWGENQFFQAGNYYTTPVLIDNTEAFPAHAIAALDDKIDDGDPAWGEVRVRNMGGTMECPLSCNGRDCRYDATQPSSGCPVTIKAGF